MNKIKAISITLGFSSELLLKNNSNPEIAMQEILGRRNEMLGNETAGNLWRHFHHILMRDDNRCCSPGRSKIKMRCCLSLNNRIINFNDLRKIVATTLVLHSAKFTSIPFLLAD